LFGGWVYTFTHGWFTYPTHTHTLRFIPTHRFTPHIWFGFPTHTHTWLPPHTTTLGHTRLGYTTHLRFTHTFTFVYSAHCLGWFAFSHRLPGFTRFGLVYTLRLGLRLQFTGWVLRTPTRTHTLRFGLVWFAHTRFYVAHGYVGFGLVGYTTHWFTLGSFTPHTPLLPHFGLHTVARFPLAVLPLLPLQFTTGSAVHTHHYRTHVPHTLRFGSHFATTLCYTVLYGSTPFGLVRLLTHTPYTLLSFTRLVGLPVWLVWFTVHAPHCALGSLRLRLPRFTFGLNVVTHTLWLVYLVLQFGFPVTHVHTVTFTLPFGLVTHGLLVLHTHHTVYTHTHTHGWFEGLVTTVYIVRFTHTHTQFTSPAHTPHTVWVTHTHTVRTLLTTTFTFSHVAHITRCTRGSHVLHTHTAFHHAHRTRFLHHIHRLHGLHTVPVALVYHHYRTRCTVYCTPHHAVYGCTHTLHTHTTFTHLPHTLPTHIYFYLVGLHTVSSPHTEDSHHTPQEGTPLTLLVTRVTTHTFPPFTRLVHHGWFTHVHVWTGLRFTHLLVYSHTWFTGLHAHTPHTGPHARVHAAPHVAIYTTHTGSRFTGLPPYRYAATHTLLRGFGMRYVTHAHRYTFGSGSGSPYGLVYTPHGLHTPLPLWVYVLFSSHVHTRLVGCYTHTLHSLHVWLGYTRLVAFVTVLPVHVLVPTRLVGCSSTLQFFGWLHTVHSLHTRTLRLVPTLLPRTRAFFLHVWFWFRLVYVCVRLRFGLFGLVRCCTTHLRPQFTLHRDHRAVCTHHCTHPRFAFYTHCFSPLHTRSLPVLHAPPPALYLLRLFPTTHALVTALVAARARAFGLPFTTRRFWFWVHTRCQVYTYTHTSLHTTTRWLQFLTFTLHTLVTPSTHLHGSHTGFTLPHYPHTHGLVWFTTTLVPAHHGFALYTARFGHVLHLGLRLLPFLVYILVYTTTTLLVCGLRLPYGCWLHTFWVVQVALHRFTHTHHTFGSLYTHAHVYHTFTHHLLPHTHCPTLTRWLVCWLVATFTTHTQFGCTHLTFYSLRSPHTPYDLVAHTFTFWFTVGLVGFAVRTLHILVGLHGLVPVYTFTFTFTRGWQNLPLVWVGFYTRLPTTLHLRFHGSTVWLPFGWVTGYGYGLHTPFGFTHTLVLYTPHWFGSGLHTLPRGYGCTVVWFTRLRSSQVTGLHLHTHVGFTHCGYTRLRFWFGLRLHVGSTYRLLLHLRLVHGLVRLPARLRLQFTHGWVVHTHTRLLLVGLRLRLHTGYVYHTVGLHLVYTRLVCVTLHGCYSWLVVTHTRWFTGLRLLLVWLRLVGSGSHVTFSLVTLVVLLPHVCSSLLPLYLAFGLFCATHTPRTHYLWFAVKVLHTHFRFAGLVYATAYAYARFTVCVCVWFTWLRCLPHT